MKLIFILSLFFVSLFSLELIQTDEFIINLKPKNGTVYFNDVIQGIAKYKNYWITTQSHKDKYLVFNIYEENGKSIFNKKINISSHGQDVSVEITKKNVYLYTTGKKWKGIAKYKIIFNKEQKIQNIKFIENINLNIGKNSPTISKDKKYIVTCANNSIYIFRKDNMCKGKYIYSFILNKKQRKHRQFKQGIFVKDNYIYMLTGGSKIFDRKYIYIYDFYGYVVKSYELFTGKNYAIKEGKKWELEGLTIKNNSIYTTVMTGENDNIIKRLYKIFDIIYEQ